MTKLKKRTKFSIVFLSSLLFSGIAFASPSINSGATQSFQQNQASTQMRDIVIMDDLSMPEIKSGQISITIPETIEAIFDDERTIENIVFYGTAVDNGRLSATPEISFDNGDKTLVIQIDQDFLAGENLTISKAYIEGFHEPSFTASYLILNVSGSEVDYFDGNYMNVLNSSLVDAYKPEPALNLTVEQISSGLEISWDNPTDLDIQSVQILRGVAPMPIDGDPYVELTPGTTSYVDTNVFLGEEISYVIRVSDGQNFSELSNTVTFTVSSFVPEPEPTPEPEPIPEPTPEPEPAPIPEVTFNDLEGHYAESEVNYMASIEVVRGNPDGSFLPDGNLNRAEAATLIHRVLGLEEPQVPLEAPFKDVSVGVWYAGYLQDLKGKVLIHGNPDGSYEPSEEINRAEFLEMALNAYEYAHGSLPVPSPGLSPYADLPEGEWYEASILEATEAGFVQGMSCETGTCFHPASQITRADATLILYRMFISAL